MNDFVMRMNIERFETALATETDPQRIVILQDLLDRENAKLADYHRGRDIGGASGS